VNTELEKSSRKGWESQRKLLQTSTWEMMVTRLPRWQPSDSREVMEAAEPADGLGVACDMKSGVKEETWKLSTLWWECRQAKPLQKIVWSCLVKPNISFGPEVLFLGVYPEEMTALVLQKTFTRIFRAALFVRAPNWNLPKCLPMVK
jgi:hypothetical protein